MLVTGKVLRPFPVLVTVITMYRGYDAETFTNIVNGFLTGEEMDAWAKAHDCDDYHCDDDEICDNHNSISFVTLELLQSHKPTGLKNVDGVRYPDKHRPRELVSMKNAQNVDQITHYTLEDEAGEWAADIITNGGWEDVRPMNFSIEEIKAFHQVVEALLNLQIAHNANLGLDAEGNPVWPASKT